MARKTAEQYMRRALALAERGRGRTSPNPLVGAVLVRNGEIVGEGYHRAVGQDHAERVAIRRAGSRARGATLYVTLEPCCHQGRTAPCTEAIVAAGVRKVVYAVSDPDPRVNGKGARFLKKAGLLVENGVLKREAVQLNESYLGSVRNGRPFTILKAAQTLDGRIATLSGDSRWITGRDSRRLAHRLRTEVDAVVVGMGTVRQDNPSLTVRHVRGVSPYRIVLSRSLAFPPRCRLLDDNSDGRTIIATTAAAHRSFARTARGKRPKLIVWYVKSDRGGLLNLRDFMEKAHQFGLRSLLVEGGARLATSFLKAGLVDKYVAITAPLLIGEGVESVGDLGIRRLEQAVVFNRGKFEHCGSDSVFVGYLQGSN